jgi:hypothetical protein
MPELDRTIFADDNWRVTLRGPVQGQDMRREYHLAADGHSDAKAQVLLRFGGEFDSIPFAVHSERYRTWRLYEVAPEGRVGMRE